MPEQTTEPVFSVISLAIPAIAALAAIVASIMMMTIRRKFGNGMLAAGFRTIAIGVMCISAGIGVAAAQNIFPLNDPLITTVLTAVKYLLLVTGTFIIVNGSKNTGDKLESMMK